MSGVPLIPLVRADLQHADRSVVASAYRREFLYSQETLIKVLKTWNGDRKWLQRLIKTKRLQGLIQGNTHNSRTLVALAIIGCEVLLLDDRFLCDMDDKGRKSWVSRERSLLERLSDKLQSGRPRTTNEDAFLDAISSDRHRAWVVTLEMTVKSIRDFTCTEEEDQ
ncbi:hypothetical protein FHETE_11434 [Fusarium heterosporum]|uniref:Uncharacterized protein n=1 Tax=Fusarium heterosporum TaxID=42747 RepID=A0A8H5WC52_FUSHE|nr:hypothetical protein FHETE_11434 [Fusarium heterosporum]